MKYSRINVALPFSLRKLHQSALSESQFQSERIEALLRADLLYYQFHGELPTLDCDRKIGDLLPRNYGKIKRMAAQTGISANRLIAVRNREIPEQDLTEEELKEIATYLGRSIEQLKEFQSNPYPY